MKYITEKIAVSPQIMREQVAELQAEGFEVVICNRPDGEEMGQPLVSEIQEEVEKQGLRFVHIPIISGQFTPDKIDEMQAEVAKGSKIFAYCRTGTRSAGLWALSQKGELSADEILDKTSAAGYDFPQLRPYLEE